MRLLSPIVGISLWFGVLAQWHSHSPESANHVHSHSPESANYVHNHSPESANHGHNTDKKPTRAQPINESEKKKTCPAGFEHFGKQCAKTLDAPPEIVCPPGTNLVDTHCAKYMARVSQCPAGYTEGHGSCFKLKSAPFEYSCPKGYDLFENNQCATRIPLPDTPNCPPGSVAKGDGCVKQGFEVPEYNCPGSYQLVGKKCQREETFDCTPARDATKQLPQPSKKGEIVTNASPTLNLRHSTQNGKDFHYTLPPITPEVEEYVVSKLCKRIITEPAHPVCGKGGNLDGNFCVIDIPVQKQIKSGGFRNQFVPARKICPENYYEDKKRECVYSEEIEPEVFCPVGTITLGSKCASYQHPKSTCPRGFYLEGKRCTKVIFAAPIYEYTITYECVGKECRENF